MDAQKSKQILDHLLATEVVLANKIRNFHWNVRGDSFFELHKFFETMYEEKEELIDEIAERVRALGFFPISNLSQFLEISSVKEESRTLTQSEMVSELVKDYELVISLLKTKISEFGDNGDVVSEDFLIGILKDDEKTLWMLRSYLE